VKRHAETSSSCQGGRGDARRPALRVIQGGRVRTPRRLATPAGAAPAVPAPEPGPLPDLGEIPVYLRPIPAWLPRLW